MEDALRLSRGMTYKAALANLAFGGGKAVIMAPANDNLNDSGAGGGMTQARFQAYGRFVDSLGDRYITAEAVGTSPLALEIVHGVTSYVASVADGGAEDRDPSQATAWGVFQGLKAARLAALGRDELHGVHGAV